MITKLSIYRFDPESKEDPGYDSFEIDTDPGETVLSVLLKLYEDYDSSLSFRFACGKVKCGECAVMVNKSPYLSCNKGIEPEMTIEPLPNLPVIKDLVIDRSRAVREIYDLAPPLLEMKKTGEEAGKLDTKGMDFYVNMTTCFECMICQSVCPVRRKKPGQFIGPLGLLWSAKADLMDSIDLKEIRDAAQMCSNCGECWKACPSETHFLEDAINGLFDKLEIKKKGSK